MLVYIENEWELVKLSDKQFGSDNWRYIVHTTNEYGTIIQLIQIITESQEQ